MSLGIVWEGLIKAYDSLLDKGAKICPIAHTYITVHIGVLINKNGEFLCAKAPDIKGELVSVPCTVESGRRTSGDHPHLLHDNLCYVAPYGKNNKRHKAYLEQLKGYVERNPGDLFANAIYNYVKTGNILNDLKDILQNIKLGIPTEKMNIAFCVYGLENEGVDLDWTEYYLSTLPKNGVCYATGNPDYIPSGYPACITSSSGKERLFLKDSGIGYIASQKIIHAIQYFAYAAENSSRVEAETHIKDYTEGCISEGDLKIWIDKKYPGKWNHFISLLKSCD
ncbi:type I-C CRISPR-associated protein Cas8c/Csd1 [Faecalimonas umbilicata]|uniref:type I-C CRISPR-associated protein Cas8c/Csd1 n=1 Tax=Faecalimonas umbilicata TaxID=1912855 RepID=UPI0022E35762|nr:type I-C CRISPR-associated protein Cas8c/Csd1 [Faecalimonas umbilicata]